MMRKTDTEKLRVSLIFLGPFPIGNVSSLRIMSYCQALAKKGHFVKVLILAPTAEAKINKEKQGIVKGVRFQYMTNITWKKEKTLFFVKVFSYLKGLRLSLKYISEDNTNCLLSYHSNIVSNIFYWIYTRINRMPFVIDKTEYPYGYSRMSKYRRRFEKFKLLFFDGFIVISDELKAFYSSINNNVFLLPMTIDTERFSCIKRRDTGTPYIAVVFGIHNRDGLYDSVVAYHKYRGISSGITCRLMLIGNLDKLQDKDVVLDYINAHKLNKHIDIKGLVPINEVPQLLVDAECLLTTPIEYVSGGFPTKLGEYMLSGTPIVATSAGEIEKYVKHKENILLSKPRDLDDIANNLLYATSDKVKAKTMGENAILWAKKVFNADTYIDDFIDFIKK